MTTLYPTYPRLHVLLGAAMPGLQLSNAVAKALEDALTEAHEHAPPPAFFARLRGIAHSHAADGQAWRERQLSEGRGRELAEATRCLAALSACGGVLLAAQSARETDDAQAQCPPQVEEGLLYAVVVLADHAGALVAPDACAPLLQSRAVARLRGGHGIGGIRADQGRHLPEQVMAVESTVPTKVGTRQSGS